MLTFRILMTHLYLFQNMLSGFNSSWTHNSGTPLPPAFDLTKTFNVVTYLLVNHFVVTCLVATYFVAKHLMLFGSYILITYQPISSYVLVTSQPIDRQMYLKPLYNSNK